MASYVLFGKIITFAMIGLAFVLVTRILGPSQYGVYTLAVAFAGIFGSIGYFGVGTALNKFISQYRELKNKEEISRVFSNAIFLVIVTGIILTLLCFTLSDFISGYIFHTSSMSYVIKAVSFWIITAMLFGTVYDSLLGFGNGKNIAVVVGIQAFFQSSISISLAILGFGALAPVFGLVFGYFLGFAAGIILMFRHNKLHLRMPSLDHIKVLLGFSWPVAAATIFGGIAGNFGLIFLGYFALPAVIGNLGIAARISSLMAIIFDSISITILPTFSAVMVNKKHDGQIGRIYGYTIYLAILIVAPLLFYMAIFSFPFVYAIFGSGYTSAYLYLSILCMGLLLGIAGSYANTLLISMGEVKLALKYNLAVYIALLLMFLIFIPLLGVAGYAVISFLISPLLIDIIFINKLRKSLKINFRARKLLGIVAANVIVSGILLPLYLLFNGSLFFNGNLLFNYIALLTLAAIGFCILYPPISVVTKGTDRGDIDTIKELSKGIPIVGVVLARFADYADMVIK